MPETTAAPPQWTPTQRELDDLDLLVNGAAAPAATGFVDPSGGELPLTLTLPAEAAEQALAAGRLDLIDPEGAPLARLTPTGSYPAGDGRTGLVGPVEKLAHNHFGAFRRLHLAPAQVHAMHPASELMAVPVRRALTSDDLARIEEAAAATARIPLLIALVGHHMPLHLTGPGLVRATLAAADNLRGAVVVAVSLADHGDANAELAEAVAAAYATQTHVVADEPVGSRPAPIEAIVAAENPPRDRQGVVIFFTGLSGSGKSTLARALLDQIHERGDRTVTSLDGDVVRHHLSKGLGFSREDRETNILRIGFVAAEIARHGGVAVCSPIAPFEATRAAVREMVEDAGGGFVLIHVATPLEECERRDRKGLYAKARRGEIPDFTGISSPYEEPRDSLKIDTTNRDIAECLSELTEALAAQGWLPR